MKTRRPNLLQFNDWMSECVKHLGRSPYLLDRHLATWFELQRITDEAMSSFGLDDTSSATPLTESRIQAVLRLFENRMQSWKDSIPQRMLTSKAVYAPPLPVCVLHTHNSSIAQLTFLLLPVPMILEYHYTSLAVYELAIGEGYRDPDAITQKYYMLPPPEDDGRTPGSSLPLSAVRVDITMKWLNAAHEILDSFLSCDVETMRKIPNITYTRVGVGLLSLQKIYYSVKSEALGEVIEPQTVNVDVYLDIMTKKLVEASGGKRYKIPDRWSYVMGVKARDWYERFQKSQAQKETGQYSQSQAGTNAAGIQSATATPLHNSQPPLLVPNDLSSRMGAFDMAGVNPMGPLQHANPGYGVPMGMSAAWSSDTNAMNLAQAPSYPPPVATPQLFYNVQQPAETRNEVPIPPPSTGMELDGWVPDGSIFGLPPLPRF